MTNLIKTKDEIQLLRKSGAILSKTISKVIENAKPGTTILELDKIAHDYILSNNCKPAFLGHHGFPNTICSAVNDQIVHGIPNDYVLKDGDIFTVDCGVIYKGYCSDSAVTISVGEKNKEADEFITNVQKTLYKAINFIKPGVKTGDLGAMIETDVKSYGYNVFKELIGHGIGQSLWEPPNVPNFGRIGKGTTLKEGMVICVEPIVGKTTGIYIEEQDGWTLRTSDGNLACQQEHMLLITKNGCEVLTQRYDEKIN